MAFVAKDVAVASSINSCDSGMRTGRGFDADLDGSYCSDEITTTRDLRPYIDGRSLFRFSLLRICCGSCR